MVIARCVECCHRNATKRNAADRSGFDLGRQVWLVPGTSPRLIFTRSIFKKYSRVFLTAGKSDCLPRSLGWSVNIFSYAISYSQITLSSVWAALISQLRKCGLHRLPAWALYLGKVASNLGVCVIMW